MMETSYGPSHPVYCPYLTHDDNGVDSQAVESTSDAHVAARDMNGRSVPHRYRWDSMYSMKHCCKSQACSGASEACSCHQFFLNPRMSISPSEAQCREPCFTLVCTGGCTAFRSAMCAFLTVFTGEQCQGSNTPVERSLMLPLMKYS